MSTSVVFGNAPNGLSAVVELKRAGSGGCIVGGLPSEKWLEAVKITRPNRMDRAYEPYTMFRIAFIPECDGYDKMPGCAIMIIPGNHDGKIESRGSLIDFNGIPATESIKDSPVCQEAFTISTNFADLKALYRALGKVITSIEGKRD